MENTTTEVDLLRAVRAAYVMLCERFLTGPAAKDAARSLAAAYARATGGNGGPEGHELSGDELISDERRRQIYAEGWTPEHDDQHKDRELARAADAYLSHYIARSWLIEDEIGLGGTLEDYQNEPPRDPWPEEWSESGWKPKGKIEDLMRAGALIAAEIDRLQRQSAPQPTA